MLLCGNTHKNKKPRVDSSQEPRGNGDPERDTKSYLKHPMNLVVDSTSVEHSNLSNPDHDVLTIALERLWLKEAQVPEKRCMVL